VARESSFLDDKDARHEQQHTNVQRLGTKFERFAAGGIIHMFGSRGASIGDKRDAITLRVCFSSHTHTILSLPCCNLVIFLLWEKSRCLPQLPDSAERRVSPLRAVGF